MSTIADNYSSFDKISDLLDESFMCMEGIVSPSFQSSKPDDSTKSSSQYSSQKSEKNRSSSPPISVINEESFKVDSVSSLVAEINLLFEKKTNKLITTEELNECMMNLFSNLDLSTSEVNKYTFWDYQKPYTRNLVATDNSNYSLIMLCWTPSKESKIHDHPGEGCFMKSIRGTVRENRYKINEDDEIQQFSLKFVSEGQVVFIDDSRGLHKIGNPCPHTGAVTLHLYTPPYKSCKVWSDVSLNNGEKLLFKDFQIGVMGFFSVYGVRTPHLEGPHTQFLRIMKQISDKRIE